MSRGNFGEFLGPCQKLVSSRCHDTDQSDNDMPEPYQGSDIYHREGNRITTPSQLVLHNFSETLGERHGLSLHHDTLIRFVVRTSLWVVVRLLLSIDKFNPSKHLMMASVLTMRHIYSSLWEIKTSTPLASNLGT